MEEVNGTFLLQLSIVHLGDCGARGFRSLTVFCYLVVGMEFKDGSVVR